MAQRKPDLLDKVLAAANDPWHTIWLCPLLVAVDAVLTGGIIWKVSYTEIDWKAYMQQISLYLSGERNYLKIQGSTGPLVYPAMHVHIYRVLHRLTSSGNDVLLAQLIFGLVYLSTLVLVMACYRSAGVPPWIYPLLILSKRLHSIYVLRLFNDPFAVLFLWAAVFAFQRKHFRFGALLYSLGLGVKMSLLLVLPAVGMVLFMAQGAQAAVGTGAVMVQYQVLMGWPFLSAYPKEYLGRAFEFGRKFEWKWTVNWRFAGREVFEDERFATGLMVGHIVILGLFVVERWLRYAGVGVGEVVISLVQPMSEERMRRIKGKVTPEFVMTSILTCNAIGMLFARSLHYQFFSWLAWGSPYLLWRSGQSPLAIVGVWFGQEVAWNIYPSTRNSSFMAVLWLAVQVYGVWTAPKVEEIRKEQEKIVRGESSQGPQVKLPPSNSSNNASKVDVDAIGEGKEALVPASSRKRGRKR
ncbi:hypothetical protein CAC42_6159 [Sphaceloma murrayae]|uniref:Dol-P-Man:Man(5)GlcNAc(2)-PP-Dol alpha-1,3-mannosyltransferase n=1 Tax=Sphaceloma murrayae TaxID=2082308 RepID=A0A2K1QTE7_9PEZI|nr:hypothetical protein CAC42_6159 [Sphaceloma murrayae]